MKKSANENRTKTNTSELVSFSWSQSHSNADYCFCISFGEPENDNPPGHYLNCEFISDDGESVDCCDVPVSDEMWEKLETLLCSVQLPIYSPPDPYLMDAADSHIRIIQIENGRKITVRHNGEYAHELFNAVTKLAMEISAQQIHKEDANG